MNTTSEAVLSTGLFAELVQSAAGDEAEKSACSRRRVQPRISLPFEGIHDHEDALEETETFALYDSAVANRHGDEQTADDRSLDDRSATDSTLLASERQPLETIAFSGVNEPPAASRRQTPGGDALEASASAERPRHDPTRDTAGKSARSMCPVAVNVPKEDAKDPVRVAGNRAATLPVVAAALPRAAQEGLRTTVARAIRPQLPHGQSTVELATRRQAEQGAQLREPIVEIHIGRIEVRSAPDIRPAAIPQQRTAESNGLERYLNRRNHGARS